MKKFIALINFALIVFVIQSCQVKQYKGTFGTNPETVIPGEEVQIYYNADSTNLKGRDSINATVYLFADEILVTIKFPMEKVAKRSGVWNLHIKTIDSALGMIVTFNSGKLEDTNKENGYIILFSDKDGNTLPEANAALASAYAKWGGMAGLKKDYKKAKQLLSAAIDKKPELKNRFLDTYFLIEYNLNKEPSKEVIKKELDALSQKKDLTAKDLDLLITWSIRLNLLDDAEKYKSQLLEKFPDSEEAQEVLLNNFRNEKDESKKLKLLYTFESKFPDSDLIQEFYGDLIVYYVQKNDLEKAYRTIIANEEKIQPFYFQYVADKMLQENFDLFKAFEIAQLGVKNSKKEYEKPTEEKPKYYTEDGWKELRGFYYGRNLFKYGEILYKQNKKALASDYLRQAVELTVDFYPYEELNELYIKSLMETNNYKKALNAATEFLKDGLATEYIKTAMKEAYIKVNGNEEGYDELVKKYLDSAKEELIAEIKSKLIKEKAPDFTLTDLNGKKVSLSDYKGKVVMVDFWATWCGPCKKSFPALKRVVQKYQDNPEVEFLFVNTWERAKDKKKNAKDFIEKNNYPFHVLLDADNKVVAEFGVRGIPTKFMIDKNGFIRYKSIGFSGKSDELVDELDIVISLIK